jgi:DNA/RNA-binding domain of Phe-tRNA-synthetase-like protein
MTNEIEIRNLLDGRLTAGVNTYYGLSPRSGESLNGYISGQIAEIRQTHGAALPPGYSFSRQLYKSFRIDPTKHRPSSEALWRRLRDRNDFPSVNPMVDLTNLLSLRYQVCFGLYDMERIHGPVQIVLGESGDGYRGIRKDDLNFAGRIVLRDDQGAFGNPSSDSLRASVLPTSLNVMQILFFHPDDPGRQRILDESTEACRRFFTMAECRSFFI